MNFSDAKLIVLGEKNRIYVLTQNRGYFHFDDALSTFVARANQLHVEHTHSVCACVSSVSAIALSERNVIDDQSYSHQKVISILS